MKVMATVMLFTSHSDNYEYE